MADFSHLGVRVEAVLTRILQAQPSPQRLKEAMSYSVLGGGKRIRATLTYLTTGALNADLALADIPAAAVELVHAYSLIHDDLPAMDDDDLRRGKPSCHIAFDEATAVLAGDALQALAFEVITSDTALPVETRLEIVTGLSQAIGGAGMVAGQMIDMAHEKVMADRSELELMHQLKTGALICLSVRLGGMIARADTSTMKALSTYGNTLGLAFQIQDDILDATGEEHRTGKPTGSDSQTGKSTFVTVLGLAEAERCLEQLLIRANDAIAPLGSTARPLQALARYVGSRDH